MNNLDQLSVESFIQQLQTGSAIPDELLQVFAEEAAEHMRAIYEGLGRLQGDLCDHDALANVRRATHTLKGAAGAVNMKAATCLAHRMEDLLDHLVDRNASISLSQVQLLLKTADQLQEFADRQYDPISAAECLVELHHAYLAELGERASNGTTNAISPATTPMLDYQRPVDGEVSGAPSVDVAVENPTVQTLRVPLQQVDNVVNLLNQMVANRSEFQSQLTDFESRIDDIQLTMARLRSATQLIEEFQGRELMASQPSSSRSRSETTSAVLTTGRRTHATHNPSPDFDSLEFERFNEFHLLSQTLAEADLDAEIMAGEFKKIKNSLSNLLRRQKQLNRDAHYQLMKIRMVPIAGIVGTLERVVRTVSGKLDKPIRLEVVGERIELDKTVLDAIVDPLLHLIRNAIDHGVENKEARTTAGKPETACLKLTAVNRGTQVTLLLSDDGAGISLEKVRRKAIEQQLIDDSESLSPEQLYALIFKPGFSTASQLTDVSGRGIGMDVVNDTIRRLNGTICVESQPGCGTTFTIQLPTTLGVSRVVMVEVGGQVYGIPLESILQTGRLKPTAVATKGDQTVTVADDQEIRLIEMATYLGLVRESNLTFSLPSPTLLLSHGASKVVVTIDAVLGTEDIIVQSLGDHLKQVRGFVGATLSGDGTVIPILDTVALIQDDSVDTWHPIHPTTSGDPLVTGKLAFVVDDSISVRRVTENLLKSAGWSVETAKDGVDALDKLAELKEVPDVFLTDMEMPRMDGLEFTRQVREQPEFAKTPIVMVTSRSSEKHRQKAFEAGASDFVVKPFNGDQLLQLITQLIQ